jgi:hypothetical protein
MKFFKRKKRSNTSTNRYFEKGFVGAFFNTNPFNKCLIRRELVH